MNYAMSDYPHCVVLERCVYMGGGATGLGDDDEYCIQVYKMDAEKWSRLPRYRYRYFAMTVINHHLTLVGGGVGRGEVTFSLQYTSPHPSTGLFPTTPYPHLVADQLYSCMTYGCWWQVGMVLPGLT